jgi:hypothetical protein
MFSVFPLRQHWRQLLAALFCTLFLSSPAVADPAGRIGRIAWLSGPVQLDNASTRESESAVLNRPLTSGDILSTAAGGRAEIHIGSLKLRIDSGSVLEMVQIDDERIRLYLSNGSLIARLPSRETAREFELATRDGRFTSLDAGHYRLDVDGASSAATLYSGSLHFDAEDSALDVPIGQRGQFWNTGRTHYRLLAPARDDFSGWDAAREESRTAGAYARYVSPEMTGAEDLDAYGNWSETPEYGAVWYPRAVAVDWAPYRSGRWVWIAPWGWSWVGEEPWGFAPFHYGRWVWHRHAWAWVPGTRIARPVYAPALVAWVGTGNVGMAISRGASPTVGWFPLAPREIYVPSYRSSPTYIRQINVTHVTRISNVMNIVNNPQRVVEQTNYAHRAQPRAVTVVPADVVTQRRPVAAAIIPQTEQTELGRHQSRADAPVAVPAAQNRTAMEGGGRPQSSGPRGDTREARSPAGDSRTQSIGQNLPATVVPPPAASQSGGVPAAPQAVFERQPQPRREAMPAAGNAAVTPPAPQQALPAPSAPSAQSGGNGSVEKSGAEGRRVSDERRTEPMPAVRATSAPPVEVRSQPTIQPALPLPIPAAPRQASEQAKPQAMPVQPQTAPESVRQGSPERASRRDEVTTRQIQREPSAPPSVQTAPQPAAATRASPALQREPESRRDVQRETPAAARTPEVRSEPHKEQRDERRHPARSEKAEDSTGRQTDDPRKR